MFYRVDVRVEKLIFKKKGAKETGNGAQKEGR